MGTKNLNSATDLITFTRASSGTALRKVSYGSELVTNGDFTTNSDWTLGNGWTISGGVAVGTNTFRELVSNTTTIISGRTYIVTFEITSYTAGRVKAKVGGTLGTYRDSVGVYTEIIVATNTDNARIVRSDLNFTGSIDNISVKEVFIDELDGTLQLFNHGNNIPRIEYDATGAVKGLLIEEARTNLLPYSNNFSYTTANDSTRYYNVATAPDGTQTADQMVEDTTTSGNHRIYFSGSVVSAATYTFSVFAKSSNRNLTLLAGSGFGEDAASFDLSNGVVLGSALGGEGVIQDVGNGWYRCSLVATNAASNTNVSWQMVMLDGDQRNYTGDGSSSISLYGAQVEAGAFPTSYIPTTGSTATRAVDVATILTANFGYNSDAGSVVAEVSHFTTESGAASAGFAFDDGSTSNRMYYYQNKGQWIGSVSGSTTFNMDTTDPLENSDTKVGAGYKKDNVSLVVNSSIVGNDTSTDIPSVNKFYFGSAASGNYLNGHIKSIKYYPRRLTNAQLQELTT